MPYKNIIYKVSDGTAEIVLNRPEKMNSLDEILIAELTELFNVISDDEEIKSVVLSGAGGNFCSGLYLDYLQKISKYDIEENIADSQRFRNMLLSIYNCSKPVIAKVSGYALAGGCGIASACDFIIADDTAKFGYTEVKIGFIPAIVFLFLTKRVPETHAKDLLLSARIISSEEAYEIGLINKLVLQDELNKEVNDLCALLSKNSTSSMALTKEMFKNVSEMTFEEGLNYACTLNAKTRMTEDFKEGIAKFLNREKK
jgi:methylglutaconyl-CoA hydratase